MTETVTGDRPPVAKPLSRPRSRKPATVSASALALQQDLHRKLEAECVLHRAPDGSRSRSIRAEIQMTSGGRFQPSEARAPADKPIVFRVKTLTARQWSWKARRSALKRLSEPRARASSIAGLEAWALRVL